MTQQFFSPVGFRFTTEMLPNLSDWIQQIDVPSLSIASTKVATPFVPVNVAGDSLVYDDLAIQFKLDEDLDVYSDIVEWMQAITFPKDHESYRLWVEKRGSVKGTGMLTLLNAKYNSIARYQFEDLTPTFLSGFYLQTDVQGIDYLSCVVRFSYTKSVFARM